MTKKNLAKDFQNLLKNISKLTNGQATVCEWDSDNLTKFLVEIRPSSGYYENGLFKFQLNITEDYPSNPPLVNCLTDVYHPNIDPTDDCSNSNICFSMFDQEDWKPDFGLEGCVLGLLFLIYNPNLDDPLSVYFEPGMDENEFAENARKSVKLEEVEGKIFMDTLTWT